MKDVTENEPSPDPLASMLHALQPVVRVLQEIDPQAVVTIKEYIQTHIDFHASVAIFVESITSQDPARQRIARQSVRRNQFKLLTIQSQLTTNTAIQNLSPTESQILNGILSLCDGLIATTMQAVKDVMLAFDQLQLLLQQEEQ